jgi:hypothetical protein
MTGASGDAVPSDGGSLVEDYLDQLLVKLVPGAPREIRRLMAEAEAHLRDATEEAVARGLTVAEAEQEAVRRFGPAAELAAKERQRRSTPLVMLARQCLTSGLFLGAVGGIAVGVSGLVAGVLRAVGGPRFIVDVAPARTLSASDCARWLAISPAAHSCQQAAVWDWANETVFYRLGVGLLGLVAMTVFVGLRRRWHRTNHWAMLPSTVVDTVAVTLFGLSGVWLLGLGVDAVVIESGHGAGQWLSAAPVAIVMGGGFALRLLRTLRQAPHPGFAPPRTT